jgi:diguanylate cyclase (GGDEF)-like protein
VTDQVSRKLVFRKIFLRPEGVLLLMAFIVTPLISGVLLYSNNKSSIQSELYQLCRHINEHLDPVKHELLASSPVLDKELQADLLTTLSIIHLSNSKIHYIYNDWYFILDTLQNQTVFDRLSEYVTSENVSAFREKYDYPKNFLSDMQTIKQGGVHIDKDVYIDSYGKTIGCMIGIKDGEKLVGVLGVDYSVDQLDEIQINITRSIAVGGVIGIIFLFIAMQYLRQYLQEKQRLLYEMDQLSRTDSLTEISNRRAFFLSCEHLAENAREDAYRAAAIIDIDFFKHVNDDYGHAAGDAALKLFAKLLNHSCNINKFVIGRIGGEEFAVFCATADKDDLISALKSFKRLLSKSPVVLGELEFSVTFSAGYKVSQNAATDVHELLTLADKALYVAKDTGRDRIVEFQG